jgi:hypothetical protein
MENNMKYTTGLKAFREEQAQLEEADRGRERYLKLVQAIREPASFSACAMDLSLQQSDVEKEEYQQIMRMLVRPGGTA